MKRKPVAPIEVEKRIADSLFHFGIISLAVYRGKDDPDYLASLEEAACELEDALAASSKWLKRLTKPKR